MMNLFMLIIQIVSGMIALYEYFFGDKLTAIFFMVQFYGLAILLNIK